MGESRGRALEEGGAETGLKACFLSAVFCMIHTP